MRPHATGSPMGSFEDREEFLRDLRAGDDVRMDQAPPPRGFLGIHVNTTNRGRAYAALRAMAEARAKLYDAGMYLESMGYDAFYTGSGQYAAYDPRAGRTFRTFPE